MPEMEEPKGYAGERVADTDCDSDQVSRVGSVAEIMQRRAQFGVGSGGAAAGVGEVVDVGDVGGAGKEAIGRLFPGPAFRKRTVGPQLDVRQTLELTQIPFCSANEILTPTKSRRPYGMFYCSGHHACS